MSEENTAIREPASQSAIEAEAAERLIARLHDPDWTADKQAELDAWLAQSVAREVAYLRLEAGWNGADRLAVLRSPMRNLFSPERKNLFGAAKVHIAAAFVLCAALGVTGYVALQPSRDQIFATPIGGRETITLADGSQIELNTDTELRLPPGSRQAVLVKGEAYFHIRHDSAHPFTLDAGGHRIVDLGTKFVVRQRPDKLEVVLVEGKARVESTSATAQPRSAVLNPGDVAIATRNDLNVTRKTSDALADVLSWRSGMVAFHHTTLGEAASELNRYNTTQIVIADQSAAQRIFGGKFRTSDAERFAMVVSAALGLHVERRPNEIVISGK